MKLPKPRKSSNVRDHSYDHGSKQLTVHFHSGKSYRYHGVTPKQAAEFAKAESRGSYLHSHIIGKCDEERLLEE